jgi:O-antigen/teichoic acid export membrane protein
MQALGMIGLALAIITNLLSVTGLALRQGIATDISRNFSPQAYWGLRSIMTFISIIIMAFLYLFVFWEDSEFRAVAVCILFLKLIESFSESCYGFMQLQGRVEKVSISLILRAVVGLAGFTGAYLFSSSLSVGVLVWAVSWLCVLIFYDRRILNETGDWKVFDSIVSVGRIRLQVFHLFLRQLPMGVAAGLGTIALSSPRVILESWTTLEIVGIFTALWVLFQAIETFLIAILHHYLTPLAITLKILQRRQIWLVLVRLLLVIMAFSAVFVAVVAFGAEKFLVYIYGDLFGQHYQTMIALAIGWSARYISVSLWHFITAQRKFWQQAFLTSTGSGLTVFSCVTFVSIEPTMLNVAYGFSLGQILTLALVMAFLFAKNKPA